jgi:hypothetical protein
LTVKYATVFIEFKDEPSLEAAKVKLEETKIVGKLLVVERLRKGRSKRASFPVAKNLG